MGIHFLGFLILYHYVRGIDQARLVLGIKNADATNDPHKKIMTENKFSFLGLFPPFMTSRRLF